MQVPIATDSGSRTSNLVQDIINEEPSPAYSPYPTQGEQSIGFGPQRPWGRSQQQLGEVSQQTQQRPNTPQSMYYHQNPQPTPLHQPYYHGHAASYNSQMPNSFLATQLRYPSGYICSKCQNSGYKKPGKPCRKCWELFGPASTLQLYRGGGHSNYYCSSVSHNQHSRPHTRHPAQSVRPCYNNTDGISLQLYPGGSSTVLNNSRNNVILVKPGDASIGGLLCATCQGSGQSSSFFSTGICLRCRGVGRTFI
ncbi:hypothetical protein G9A89_008089 [Geosiphon pyriformis]|nr:hypothetical protein G9A89_008089 [Geosiphon pyriformis]